MVSLPVYTTKLRYNHHTWNGIHVVVQKRGLENRLSSHKNIYIFPLKSPILNNLKPSITVLRM